MKQEKSYVYTLNMQYNEINKSINEIIDIIIKTFYCRFV